MSDYNKIAREAEANLNSYQNKTGNARRQGNDESGVDSRVERDFPGASVQTGDDLSTNRGFDKRIPPNEGGDLDDLGRQTRGSNFEGRGGPEDKLAQRRADRGGDNDIDVDRSEFVQAADSGDPATFGRQAAQSNISQKARAPQYKGSDYYTPESVPDSISAEGNIPPESIIQSSREAEHP